MRVERVGYGAGQKDFRIPNVLRLSVGTLDAGWRRRPVPAGRAGAGAAERRGGTAGGTPTPAQARSRRTWSSSWRRTWTT